jgi:hypothetical protein
MVLSQQRTSSHGANGVTYHILPDSLANRQPAESCLRQWSCQLYIRFIVVFGIQWNRLRAEVLLNLD